MQCPLCLSESLETMVRGEVEIDVCPRCRGVWLDRGEIDKLAGGEEKIRKPREERSRKKSSSDRDRGRDRDRDRDRDDDDDKRRERKRRKKNFGERLADVLDDVFD